MRAITHYLFSCGASLGILSVIHLFSLSNVVIALWLSVSINYLVDLLGHSSRDGIPARTRVTHSVFTAPLWGVAIAIVSLSAFWQASGAGFVWYSLVLWASMGVFISGEHLFLDSLTQAGVYLWRRRIALAHFSYDNLALNLGFALIGTFLIAATLGL